MSATVNENGLSFDGKTLRIDGNEMPLKFSVSWGTGDVAWSLLEKVLRCLRRLGRDAATVVFYFGETSLLIAAVCDAVVFSFEKKGDISSFTPRVQRSGKAALDFVANVLWKFMEANPSNGPPTAATVFSHSSTVRTVTVPAGSISGNVSNWVESLDRKFVESLKSLPVLPTEFDRTYTGSIARAVFSFLNGVNTVVSYDIVAALVSGFVSLSRKSTGISLTRQILVLAFDVFNVKTTALNWIATGASSDDGTINLDAICLAARVLNIAYFRCGGPDYSSEDQLGAFWGAFKDPGGCESVPFICETESGLLVLSVNAGASRVVASVTDWRSRTNIKFDTGALGSMGTGERTTWTSTGLLKWVSEVFVLFGVKSVWVSAGFSGILINDGREAGHFTAAKTAVESSFSGEVDRVLFIHPFTRRELFAELRNMYPQLLTSSANDGSIPLLSESIVVSEDYYRELAKQRVEAYIDEGKYFEWNGGTAPTQYVSGTREFNGESVPRKWPRRDPDHIQPAGVSAGVSSGGAASGSSEGEFAPLGVHPTGKPGLSRILVGSNMESVAKAVSLRKDFWVEFEDKVLNGTKCVQFARERVTEFENTFTVKLKEFLRTIESKMTPGFEISDFPINASEDGVTDINRTIRSLVCKTNDAIIDTNLDKCSNSATQLLGQLEHLTNGIKARLIEFKHACGAVDFFDGTPESLSAMKSAFQTSPAVSIDNDLQGVFAKRGSYLSNTESYLVGVINGLDTLVATASNLKRSTRSSFPGLSSASAAQVLKDNLKLITTSISAATTVCRYIQYALGALLDLRDVSFCVISSVIRPLALRIVDAKSASSARIWPRLKGQLRELKYPPGLELPDIPETLTVEQAEEVNDYLQLIASETRRVVEEREGAGPLKRPVCMQLHEAADGREPEYPGVLGQLLVSLDFVRFDAALLYRPLSEIQARHLAGDGISSVMGLALCSARLWIAAGRSSLRAPLFARRAVAERSVLLFSEYQSPTSHKLLCVKQDRRVNTGSKGVVSCAIITAIDVTKHRGLYTGRTLITPLQDVCSRLCVSLSAESTSLVILRAQAAYIAALSACGFLDGSRSGSLVLFVVDSGSGVSISVASEGFSVAVRPRAGMSVAVIASHQTDVLCRMRVAVSRHAAYHVCSWDVLPKVVVGSMVLHQSEVGKVVTDFEDAICRVFDPLWSGSVKLKRIPGGVVGSPDGWPGTRVADVLMQYHESVDTCLRIHDNDIYPVPYLLSRAMWANGCVTLIKGRDTVLNWINRVRDVVLPKVTLTTDAPVKGDVNLFRMCVAELVFAVPHLFPGYSQWRSSDAKEPPLKVDLCRVGYALVAGRTTAVLPASVCEAMISTPAIRNVLSVCVFDGYAAVNQALLAVIAIPSADSKRLLEVNRAIGILKAASTRIDDVTIEGSQVTSG